MLELTLKEIGLTDGEIKVYVALLDSGSTTTGTIIKQSKISASKVYNILERLGNKGLVSYIMKQKTKYFQATDPKRILDYLAEKEKALGEQRHNIQKVLPQLIAKYQDQEKAHEEVEMYKGLNGVRNMFYSILDMLKRGEEYFVIGAGWGYEREDVIRTMLNEYHRKRAEKGITANLLFNFESYPLARSLGYRLCTIKPMPQELTTNSQIMIFKNNVFIILWKKEPLGFVIKDQELRDSFKTYFDMLWNRKTNIYSGDEGLQELIAETLHARAVWFIGGGGYISVRMPEYWKVHNEKRIKKKQRWRILAREMIENTPLAKEKYVQYKILPKTYTAPNVVWVFGNTVANVLWTKKPIAFVIENKEIAESYREYFKYLWENIMPHTEITKII